MTQQDRDGISQNLPSSDDRPLELPRRFAAAGRKHRRGPVTPVLLACVAAAVVGGGLAINASRGAIADMLTGASPNLSDAQTCLRNREIACAEADYRAYLRKYPNDASASAILAIVLTQDGRHQEAIPYYKHALTLGMATYDLYANYAVSLNTLGRVDEAIVQNYAALRLVPSLVDVRSALANELVKRGRGREALGVLESFDQSLEQQGQARYFPSQIAQIRGELGLSQGTPETRADDVGTPVRRSKSEVPMEASDGGLYVTAIINGSIGLKFVVDSGASDVCIPADVVQTLMRTGTLTLADGRGIGVAVLADGSKVRSERVMIHSINVGGHEVKNVLALVTSAQGSLLLGQTFLKRFKSWSVDNHRKVLVLSD